MPISRVLVSGASGLVGTSLVRDLTANSIQVTRLIRGPAADSSEVFWDPFAPDPIPELHALASVDAAVHLSGANVSGHRWTAAYKREIVASRVQSTRTLATAIAQLDPKPAVLISASAIGFYGDRGDEILTESSPLGGGFLADTCQAWETATGAAEAAGIQVIHLRFGVVLDAYGGALAAMLPVFRLGLGGKMGNGRQWMSWLTLRDAVAIIRYCIDDRSMSGEVNAVSPNPVTNGEFARALAHALGRPAFLTMPTFVAKAMFGEMAKETLLASVRAVPGTLQARGFRFADPEIGLALKKMLAR